VIALTEPLSGSMVFAGDRLRVRGHLVGDGR